jgi:Protein of unknown function (DUF3631)
MTAINGETDQASNPAGVTTDPDVLVAKFLARAAALPKLAHGATDSLMADIAASGLSDFTLKPLADAIAKATGFEKGAICKGIEKARGAYEAAAADSVAHTAAPACVSDPEPSASPPPLGKLLRAVAAMVTQRVYCLPHVADAVALWCIGSWGVNPPGDPTSGPDIFPRLHLHSPTKRCGKSTLLEIVQSAVRRPLAATDVTVAVIFRSVDKWHPTLIIDEADRLFAKNQELTGIINSGHTRSGYALRLTEVPRQGVTSYEPTSFSTFAAVALAGIGSLPSTIEDRSIRIDMQRQPDGQKAKAQRIGLKQLANLRSKIAPHFMAHADAIGAAMATGVPDSDIPSALNDRDGDNWRPLLGLALLAGGGWLARAQHAAGLVCRVSADGDRGNEWALQQIVEHVTEGRAAAVAEWQAWVRSGRKTVKPLPGRPGVQRATPFRYVVSDNLAAWLMGKDDSGFGDAHDTPTVKLRIARLLRTFGVRPTVRRFNGMPTRGYDVSAIRAVWRRYQS